MAHTLTRANFDAMREGLNSESTMNLEQLIRGCTMQLTPTQRKNMVLQCSTMIGHPIPAENLAAAMQFVAHTAKAIIASRNTK